MTVGRLVLFFMGCMIWGVIARIAYVTRFLGLKNTWLVLYFGLTALAALDLMALLIVVFDPWGDL